MGKTLASYLVRITLHERDDAPAETWPAGPPKPPTNAQIEETVQYAVQGIVEYWRKDDIGVSSERLDQ